MKHWVYLGLNPIYRSEERILEFLQKTGLIDEDLRITEDHTFLYPSNRSLGLDDECDVPCGGFLVAFPVEGEKAATNKMNDIWRRFAMKKAGLWRCGVYKRPPIGKKNSLRFCVETRTVTTTQKIVRVE